MTVKFWSENEINALIKMKSDGLTSEQIAKSLGRSKGSICSKANRMFDEKILKMWTKEEDEKLIELYNNGYSTEDIAIELNRTKASIMARKKKFNLSCDGDYQTKKSLKSIRSLKTVRGDPDNFWNSALCGKKFKNINPSYVNRILSGGSYHDRP